MKIVIVGDGKVGLTLTEQLSAEGHDIVIIDRNQQVLRDSQEAYDVMVVNGNGASMQVLKEAGADTADLLIAATSGDEINMLCCITAKKMGCRHTIARVRNPEYHRQLSFLKEELGLSMTINPEASAAREIFHILQFPSSTNRDFFAKGQVELVEFTIRSNSPAVGQSLMELYRASRVKIIVCAVERGNSVFIPNGDFVLQAGDVIHVTGANQNLTALMRYLKLPSNRIREVLIVGGSRLGYYLAESLTRVGMKVKIIERNYDRCVELSELLPKVLVINGDACDQKLMNAECAGKTDALIALTDIDEINLVISLFASQIGVPKTITKMDRIDQFEAFKAMGVESIISPKHIICDDVLRYVRAMRNHRSDAVISLHRLVNHRVEALEFRVEKDMPKTNIPLKDLTLKKNILLACIRRRGKLIFPDGNETIQPEDTVIVVSTTENKIANLRDIFAAQEFGKK